jgi:hypothetical protein
LAVTRPRDLIIQEIAHEESRGAELARALDEIRAKIALLHSELDAVSAPTPLSRRISSSPDGKSALTSADKVKLFRSLFRGRTDVFPLRNGIDDLVASYGHVIIDECHHLAALSFENVLSEVKARYIVGLTATSQRRDGRDPITEMQLGPVRFRVNAKSQAARRPYVDPRETSRSRTLQYPPRC